MKTYKVLMGYVIYPDDIDYVAEGLFKDDVEKLGEDISRFYRGTTYWGD